MSSRLRRSGRPTAFAGSSTRTPPSRTLASSDSVVAPPTRGGRRQALRADPNTLARNPHIQTSALHAAAAGENKDSAVRFELCKLLLEHGADPNLRQGQDGFRAIDAARQNGDKEVELLLVDHGAEG